MFSRMTTAERRAFNNGLQADGQEVANMLKVSRRTLFNGLKSARDHDTLLKGLVWRSPPSALRTSAAAGASGAAEPSEDGPLRSALRL